MKVLVLSAHDVEELLTFDLCIAAMEDVLAALARGEVHNPLRSAVRGPGANGILGLMPAWRGGDHPVYALKEIGVFPGNPRRGLDSHVGAVILHSGETGEPLAFMNASAITAIRTAAVSAVATKLLAAENASVLAILGAGVQAKSHVQAISHVRNIREVRVFSRSGSASGFRPPSHATLKFTTSAEEAVRGADVIVTATSSREPVLRLDWISRGAHINAVGSSIPAARELDAETVAACALFVDRRESTVAESGDYLFALREGAIAGPEHIRAELGEILTGSAQGRRSAHEITLFKSLGLAAEDLAAAVALCGEAQAKGRGTWIDF